MKIIIEVPNEKVKSLIATAALATGEDIPEGLIDLIGATTQVNLTEEIEEDPELKSLISGLGMMAGGKLIKKLEDEEKEKQKGK